MWDYVLPTKESGVTIALDPVSVRIQDLVGYRGYECWWPHRFDCFYSTKTKLTHIICKG